MTTTYVRATKRAPIRLQGFEIYGQDFSERMTQIARRKMPEAKLYTQDLSDGLHRDLKDQTFDVILSTYVLHHLEPEAQIHMIRTMHERLNAQSLLLLGDITFLTQAEQVLCRQQHPDWDEDEYYFIYEEMRSMLPGKVRFEKISHCSGILMLEKR